MILINCWRILEGDYFVFRTFLDHCYRFLIDFLLFAFRRCIFMKLAVYFDRDQVISLFRVSGVEVLNANIF